MSSEKRREGSWEPEAARSYHPEWREVQLLDTLDLEGLVPPEGGLYSNLPWDDTPFVQCVQHVRRSAWLTALAQRVGRRSAIGKALTVASDVGLAWRLWRRSGREKSCGLVEHERATLLFLILRSWLPRRGRVVLFGPHLQPCSALRRRLVRRAVGSADACVVWSRRSGVAYANELGLAGERFVVVPFKANHSKEPEEGQVLRGDYVFAGGDSERDYRTLFQAVEGLNIPVVVSTMDPALTAGCVPANVIVVQAREPHFRRLMAGARLVVVPLTGRRMRGAGEGTFLNAMWHRLAVVCADDVSAPEYIENGVDGVVVPPEDVDALRTAIRSLWDDPEKARRMGLKGRAKVESSHCHDLFCERLVKLGSVLARDGKLPEK
jgi:hypothetical protein